MQQAVPTDIDPFSDAYIQAPYGYHHELRELGPVIWLQRYNAFAVPRLDEVRTVLGDAETFCSSAGVGLTNFRSEKPWRPKSLLLETDPPDHTRNRTVISHALAPKMLQRVRPMLEAYAAELVDRVVEKQGIDAMPELALDYPMRVFADAVGVPEQGRAHLIQYGSMVFNTMGPRNDNFEQAMHNSGEVISWIGNACLREVLTKDGLGATIYDAADQEVVGEQDAGLIVRSFLSAGIDTTVAAIGSMILCLAQHPVQWQELRANPNLAKSAFEEVMRYETPFQSFFRTTTQDTALGDVRIPDNSKVMVLLGSANRDPLYWEQPEEFDIHRRTTGHVGFGYGIHGCVGQMMARQEVEILLQALLARVESIELTGEPEWLSHNTIRVLKKLPVKLHA